MGTVMDHRLCDTMIFDVTCGNIGQSLEGFKSNCEESCIILKRVSDSIKTTERRNHQIKQDYIFNQKTFNMINNLAKNRALIISCQIFIISNITNLRKI